MNNRSIAIISIVIISACLAAISPAQTAPVDDDIKTKGFLNGRAIMQFMSGDETGKYYATQFIAGVLEGMTATKAGSEMLLELYPGLRRETVIKAVIEYYINNPAKRFRPVVDVVLSGCK
jgi:hypothetical protein